MTVATDSGTYLIIHHLWFADESIPSWGMLVMRGMGQLLRPHMPFLVPRPHRHVADGGVTLTQRSTTGGRRNWAMQDLG